MLKGLGSSYAFLILLIILAQVEATNVVPEVKTDDLEWADANIFSAGRHDYFKPIN
ncbi:hypothetical protein NDK43_09535 [Neobacillus pocheonensis]|uniref:Uncharacterized protein n=1 Tax=Neobacillus pocheonensis TaxID=363869 RepID=A0ABT0WC23_9BACI|nr:hypothetical protein [Neobacillus pocheonensis]